MKVPGSALLGLRLCALFGLLVLPGGCNDNPDTSELDNYFAEHPYVSDPRTEGTQVMTISPETFPVDILGQSVVFTASGGTPPYQWDVSTPAVGHITPSGDTSQGTYTADAIGDNDVIVSDVAGHAAIAHISGTLPADYYVTASANPATLATDHAIAVLTASGGLAPYTWSVTHPGRGQLPDGNTGITVVYERYSAGDNAVTVTDGRGNTTSLVISQP